MTSNISGTIVARLDRLVFSASLKKLVALISLGGAFEFYDLFMTAYIAPGLLAAHLFSANAAGFFAPDGVGFFVFCTFAGMWAGSAGSASSPTGWGGAPSSPFPCSGIAWPR